MGISSALGGAGAVPIGVVNPFAGATAPSGWLLCYGQAISRTEYPVLFTTLSTTYGAGDGSTTFNIPDMRGRAVAGKDDMGGTAASRITSGVAGINGSVLGQAGGSQSHTMTSAEMPSHTHTQNSHNHAYAENHPYAAQGSNDIRVDKVFGTLDGIGYVSSVAAVNQNTGGGGAHNNTQPTIILNYIIKAQ
jgi:microcystin-dependent protein